MKYEVKCDDCKAVFEVDSDEFDTGEAECPQCGRKDLTYLKTVKGSGGKNGDR